jgi:hypothetical protein
LLGNALFGLESGVRLVLGGFGIDELEVKSFISDCRFFDLVLGVFSHSLDGNVPWCAAIDPLHLIIVIDNQENRRLSVHEVNNLHTDLELPVLDQVLWSTELEQQDAVLLLASFIPRVHQDEELIVNGGTCDNRGDRLEV